MTGIGVNGFGRIGKLIFLQLLENNENVLAINIPDFDINNLETYLNYDSVHKFNKKWKIIIKDENQFFINDKRIHILNNRDASQLNWRKYGVQYLIDASGVYLTQEKAKQHDCDYVIMCAPPKDDTPSFMVNGNQEKYKGEKIVSNVSCTSNAIIPVLKILHNSFGIIDANFITIHSTTASQQTVDTVKFKNRTSRSIFNNIIPHTTGASESIYKILPELKGKIHGTSVRVPVSNVSLIDLNVTLQKDCDLQEVLRVLDSYTHITVDDNKYKISCDYNTTICPSIIDKKACMEMQKNQFKLSIWYDNEYSYSHKVIQLLKHMVRYNSIEYSYLSKDNFIENMQFKDKRVVLRVDWNVPIKNNELIDYFRITSTMKTIEYILRNKPKYIVIVSHLGRPKSKNDIHLSFYSYSKQIENIIMLYFKRSITFLDSILSTVKTKLALNSCENGSIFLLDNIRYMNEETNYESLTGSDKLNRVKELYLNMGDVFVNDAFGCTHRNHMSITAPLCDKSKWCYGYIIKDEINILSELLNKDNKKVLAIIGGAKMDDKLPLLENLSKKIDGIYIAGGNINGIIKQDKYSDFINSITVNTARIVLMKDGLSSTTLEGTPSYHTSDNLPENEHFFDIGMESVNELINMISEYDMIFWNGTLGVVENDLYKQGSTCLIQALINSNKKVIVGGGDTGSFVNTFSHNLYYISTGGGASLEYLSQEKLIGLM